MSVLKTTSNLQKNLAFARFFHIFFARIVTALLQDLPF